MSESEAERSQRLAYLRAYRASHSEYFRTNRKKYREYNLAYTRAYHKAHPDEAKEANRRFRELHPEYAHEWGMANRDRRRVQSRDYYEEHRAKVLAQTAARQRANPEQQREKQHRRRARLRQAPIERISHQDIFDRDNGLCRICGKAVDRAKMTLDHIVPIAEGGAHCASNVQLAHRLCNVRRQHRGPAQTRLW